MWFRNRFILFYVCDCFICMHLCVLCMPGAHRSLELELTHGCEPQWGCCELTLGPLQEQQYPKLLSYHSSTVYVILNGHFNVVLDYSFVLLNYQWTQRKHSTVNWPCLAFKWQLSANLAIQGELKKLATYCAFDTEQDCHRQGS